MIEPDVLADRLERLAKTLRSPQGAKAWSRVADWSDPGPMPSHSTPPQPGDDDFDPEMAEARTFVPGAAERREDWLEDRIVGGHQAELDKLTARVLVPALNRVARIVEIATPGKAKHLADQHLQKAQVAASGCCVSCWQDDKTLNELSGDDLRPDGHPRFKDHCRFCGEWKSDHGFYPPAWVLRKRRIHGKRTITTADVAKAIAEAKQPKGGKR